MKITFGTPSSTWMINKKIRNNRPDRCSKFITNEELHFELNGTACDTRIIFLILALMATKKVHQRDGIGTPPEHICIKWRAIGDYTHGTLSSPILQ